MAATARVRTRDGDDRARRRRCRRRAYPWKLVIGMFLVGVGVVLVGAALYEPTRAAPPDNLLGPGSCVVIEANGDAREINCTGAPGELVVDALVAMDERCPDGTSAYRDRQGRGLAA